MEEAKVNENSERAERISNALKRQGGRAAPEEDSPSHQITKADYDALMEDRPKKFSSTAVGYRIAPRGSEQRCGNCAHFYVRMVDKFSTCEIFRSVETDAMGVNPHYLCDWWTSDGEKHPLTQEDH